VTPEIFYLILSIAEQRAVGFILAWSLAFLQWQLSDVSQFSGQDCEKYSDNKHGH